MKALVGALGLLAFGIVAGCGEDPPAPGTGGGGGEGAAGGSGGAGATSTSATSAGGAGGTGGGSSAECKSLNEPCSNCAIEQCNDLYCECFGNAACKSLVLCLSGCAAGDEECFQQCLTVNEDGISDAFLVADCVQDKCADTACEFPLDEVTECQTCLFGKCEADMNACIANPDCSQILFCFQECEKADPVDPTCGQKCYDASPGGQQDLDAVNTCRDANCDAVCPVDL